MTLPRQAEEPRWAILFQSQDGRAILFQSQDGRAILFQSQDGSPEPTGYPKMHRAEAQRKVRELNSGWLSQEGHYMAVEEVK